MYEVRLKHVEDVEERLVLLRETGLIYEERLKDPATAFAKFLEAFALAPAREITREESGSSCKSGHRGLGQADGGL